MSNSRASSSLVAIIADEDTVTGFLLAGVGNIDMSRNTNYLVVGKETTQPQIEDAFRRFTAPDAKPAIGVLLISQGVANDIRHLLEDYSQVLPAILEIPSKDLPYDPSADYILRRVKKLTGIED